MSSQANEEKRNEIQELRERIARLEAEIEHPPRPRWHATEYYTMYYANAGFFLGIFGAATSLLFNVVGSALIGQHPLRLIQVYLTFPLGEQALTPQFDSGLMLAVGCCLYIATGMVLGIPLHLTLTYASGGAPDFSLPRRLLIATLFSIGLWLVNFYGVLYWLQPALFSGNWIVELIPPWVALATHLVFGWTMAFVYPLGLYKPYRLQTEEPSARQATGQPTPLS